MCLTIHHSSWEKLHPNTPTAGNPGMVIMTTLSPSPLSPQWYDPIRSNWCGGVP